MQRCLAAKAASPKRVVRLYHEAAKGFVVTPVQGGRCLGRAPDLTHDVTCSLEALLAHQLSASWEGKGGRLGRGSLQSETWF